MQTNTTDPGSQVTDATSLSYTTASGRGTCHAFSNLELQNLSQVSERQLVQSGHNALLVDIALDSDFRAREEQFPPDVRIAGVGLHRW